MERGKEGGLEEDRKEGRRGGRKEVRREGREERWRRGRGKEWRKKGACTEASALRNQKALQVFESFLLDAGDLLR